MLMINAPGQNKACVAMLRQTLSQKSMPYVLISNSLPSQVVRSTSSASVTPSAARADATVAATGFR